MRFVTLGKRRAVLAAALLALASVGAAAQEAFPNRAIRMIVPFAAGNSADIVARMISERLTKSLGQTVVVENRPGASGGIGLAALAAAAPDGYTIAMGSIGPLALNPSLYSKLAYDAQKGFSMISVVYRGPSLFLVDPASPITSLKDLVQLSRNQPAGVDFASAGSGSIMHLIGEQFARATNARMTHVPNRGTGAAATLVLGKHAPVLIENSTASISFVRSGQLRPLAHTGAQRLPALPNVPTIVEAGFPSLVTEGWLVVIGPAAMPAPIRERLYEEIRKIMSSPEVQTTIANSGGFAEAMTPEQSTTYVRTEAARWAEVIRATGVKLD